MLDKSICHFFVSFNPIGLFLLSCINRMEQQEFSGTCMFYR